MKKMIVTANIEFSMENNSGEKTVIKSAANLEVSANNCAAYPQKIGNAAFDCLRMAMEADDTTNAVYSSLNKMIIEENESSNDKVDRGDAPIEPILIKERKGKTVNTFAGTAKVKNVKKPMIHLLTTEDAPHGEFSKKLLCISSITEDNISILKDIKEARHIDAKRFKHLVSIDSSFFSNLGINCMSLKNKIFKTQSDLLVHLCKPKSEVFVSLDAIEILKANSGARRPFNTGENLLTYEEIVNKYLGLEHEDIQTPCSPMAKTIKASELENMNRLMTQVDRPKFRAHYTHPYAPFPQVEAAYKYLFPKSSDLDISNVNNLVAESNEKDINLLGSKSQGQVDLKKILQDLNYKTRVLLTMFVGTSDASSELKEDLNTLINRANFIATREILNYKLNKEVISIEKIQSLINEMDDMITSLDREVIYLYIPEHRSYIAEALKDTNKENWYFTLAVNKTRYLRIKGTEFPKNVLVSKFLRDAILHHIENSKCMHYTTIHNGISELKDTDTLSSLTKDFDIYMRQDDIDAFMEMIKIGELAEAAKSLKDTYSRLGNVDIKVDETLSKLTGGNENEALGFYGAFAKAFKEAMSKDTLLSKIVNNPRWNNMEKSAGVKSNIMKIDRRNTVGLCNAEIEFLTNVNIECINIEFPSFKRVPENKINKLLSVISLSNEGLNHHEKSQIASAVLENGIYMSDEDLELLLDREQCENCSKKHTGDFDSNAARLPLKIKDYSLDALKKLTQSLKRFPEGTHFIVLGVNEDTNELFINDGLYGIPRDLNLYRVCKKRASLFQYLDLGDIILGDLLNTKIYLTESFIATVCDKLKIDVKTFQKKIFYYGTYRYPVEQIIKRHDFDGDRISSCVLKEPLQDPTITTLTDNSLSGWDSDNTVFLRNPSFSYYWQAQRFERSETEFVQYVQEEHNKYVKHCLISNLEIDNDLYIYKYTSNTSNPENVLYVLLNMQVANAVSRRTSSANIKLEPIQVTEGKIVIPRPNMTATFMSDNFVFLSLDKNNISSNIGLRTRMKILLGDFNKKFKDKLGNKGYLENSISGFSDTEVEEASNNHKEDLLNLTYPISSVIREYKKSEISFIETVKKIEKEHDLKGIYDDYGIYYYKSKSLVSRDSDVYVMLRKIVAAELFMLQKDTNTSSIQQIPHTLFGRCDTVFIPNNARQILCQTGGVVFLERDVNDRGRTPKVSLRELNKKPNFKVKDIKVVAEHHLTSGGSKMTMNIGAVNNNGTPDKYWNGKIAFVAGILSTMTDLEILLLEKFAAKKLGIII